MTTRPKALMACHLDWEAPMRVGSHHIARCLVESGWDVAFVSNAISPFQLLRSPDDFRRKARQVERRGSLHLDGHLWSVVPFALLTPHNAPVLRSKWVHRHWQRTSIPSLAHQVREAGFGRVDLLYVDSPGQRFWLDQVDYQASATRVMDRMDGFKRYPGEMRSLEIELVKEADVTFFSAVTLEEGLKDAGARRLVHLPNGVDFAHFASRDLPVPGDMADVAGPIVLYSGAIDEWFDFDTVNQVTGAMKDVSFVFIGPDQLARKRLVHRSNVHVMGWRAFADLPAYLAAADVGLIPFDVNSHPDLVHSIHPLKLYEYLAAGLPVVATCWNELERMQSPAVLVDGPAEMESGLRTVLDAPPDRGVGVAYARAADWSARVDTMLEAVRTGPAGSYHP